MVSLVMTPTTTSWGGPGTVSGGERAMKEEWEKNIYVIITAYINTKISHSFNFF